VNTLQNHFIASKVTQPSEDDHLNV